MTKAGLIHMLGINVFLRIFGRLCRLPDYFFPWRKAAAPCQLRGTQRLKVTLT